jgi:hypothetical protein
MFFAMSVGILLGISNLQTSAAMFTLALALALKVVFDIRWDRVPLLGRVSPYVIYYHNLQRAGEPVNHAWISYTLQLLLFGALAGVAGFGLVRYIRTLL